jgi:hypothetical protein
MQERSKVTIEGAKESEDSFNVFLMNDNSVNQIPSKLSHIITLAKDIEFIVHLYPKQLRTLPTIFRLDIEGVSSPFFLHSHVAYLMILNS